MYWHAAKKASYPSFFTFSIAAVAFVALVGCSDSSSETVDGGGADATADVGVADLRGDVGASDTGGADTNGADTGSDLNVDAGQPCCTAAACAAMGMVCNTQTCICETLEPDCQNGGESCDPNEAQPSGFVCIATTADPSSGTCRKTCPSGSCSSGEFCHGDGYCLPSQCTHFFDNDCPQGEQCVPADGDANRCAEVGSGGESEDCAAQEDCGMGLLCLGQCVAPGCAPDSSLATCGALQDCERLSVSGEPVDLGLCSDYCVPFVDPAQSGCELDEVCWPSMTLRGQGACIPTWTGTAQQGDACDGLAEATTCAIPDLLCLSDSETTAHCQKLCDPVATGSEPGQCPTGEGCAALKAAYDETLAYGTCTASCVYTHGSPFDPATPCVSGGICAPGFLYNVSFDVCVASYDDSLTDAPLDAGEACPQGSDYAYCRPNGLCLDMGGGLNCMDFCDAAIGGGLGSASHPDCSQSGAVCTALGSNSTFGYCAVP